MHRRRSSDAPDMPIDARPGGLGSWVAALGLSSGGAPIDLQATAEKARTVAQVAPWMMAAHLIAGVALLLVMPAREIGALILPGLLLALVVLLDCALIFGARHRAIWRAGPLFAARLLAGHGLLTGIVWAGATAAAPVPAGAGLVIYLAAQAGAAALMVCAFAPVAAAAIAVSLPLILLASVRSGSVEALVMILMALCLYGALLATARRAHVALRRRIGADWAAHKASRLLAEFEQSRRGWFWETDDGGRLTYISAQLEEAIGAEPGSLAGSLFTELVHNEIEVGQAVPRGERTLGFHLSAKIAFSDVAVRAAVPGEVRWWSLSGRPAIDEFGNFMGFRGNGTDLTEMRRSEAEVTRLARYDALTGLPNRMLMRQTFDAALHDVAGRPAPCALFLLDLDRFKTVNDTLGHPVGDALLRQVAERLQSVIGEQGRVGRLGGDEFKVVFPGFDNRADLARLAERVIERLSETYQIEGSHVSIGTSIGIAIAPEDGATVDSLVRNADLALYAAKAAGKGVHCFYQPEMHANAKDRRLLEIDLRKVLSDGGLHLVYQPVVNAMSERITGFEALARWNHPTRGPVSPSSFIPIAEEIGLIPQIGEWVLRTACLEAAKWPDKVRVAVNISPIQFANPSLPAIVMNALAAAQLPAERLELEITEGVFLSEDDATDEMFARLKAIGVRFALDDFGTGYSSLGYLKKAPFNKIKIDQSFVRGAAIAGSRNAAIIKAIVSLAESLDMETTAEGAETHDELELIRTLGCSHIQGYIFGRPMPAEEALERVRDGAVAVANGYLASRLPRVQVLRAVTLRHSGGIFVARLRNLSNSGAMVETDDPPAPGTQVAVGFPDGSIYPGVVRWSQDGRLGMTFDREFDVDQLNATGGRRLRAG